MSDDREATLRRDDPGHDTPEEQERQRRMAKHVLFGLAVTPPILLILALLTYFQPDDQVLMTRHENGYPATRSRHVMGPGGRPQLHGEHEAWHQNGRRSEHGWYTRGARSGTWRFWNEKGELLESSGIYREGQRVSDLGEER